VAGLVAQGSSGSSPTAGTAGSIVASGWAFSSESGRSGPIEGSYPLLVQLDRKAGESGGVTFTSNFAVPADWKGPLGIVLYKNNMSCRVFVNGVYIDTLGRPGPDFFFQPYITRGVSVPQSILRDTNELRLELWSDTGTYKLRKLDFMDESAYRASMNRFNFFDIQLNRFASVMLLFVCMYSLFLFVNYRKRKEILYLSLASFFFAVFLLNISAFDAPIPYLTLRGGLYACFPLSIIFIFQFFRVFFGMKTGKIARRVIAGIGVFFALGYFFQPTSAALDAWQSLMLLYPCAAIAYGFIGGVKALRAGNVNAIPIMLGLFATLVLSGYDVYYFIGDVSPTVMLQGIGFMCMIIGTFYSFSQEIADTNKKVAQYSVEMEKSKETRDSLFAQIRADTIKSEDASSRLDQSIERVGTLVTQYLASSTHINESIMTQNEHVISNKRNIEDIFAALEQTQVMVEHHENLVQVTVKNVQELTAGIHRTDGLVKESGKTIKSLTSVCLAADKDVAESSRFVDDLANYSQNINEIVKSIGDLAEQTNILSINAAIEAARSGQMGKGFAVVASEIRALASKSGESANQIKAILGTMVDKIKNIQRQESQVSLRLKDIVRENSSIESSIAEIFDVLENQLKRNEIIGSTVNELVVAVRTILEQTSSQKSYGETIRESIQKLESVTRAIVTSSEDQKQCNEELKSNLSQLQSVSENNLDVVQDLRSLISQES